MAVIPTTVDIAATTETGDSLLALVEENKTVGQLKNKQLKPIIFAFVACKCLFLTHYIWHALETSLWLEHIKFCSLLGKTAIHQHIPNTNIIMDMWKFLRFRKKKVEV